MSLVDDPGVWQQIRQGRAPTDEGVAAVARRHRGRLGSDGAAVVADRLRQEVLGLGPLEPLVDARTTDLLLNGTEVWLDRGRGLERGPQVLPDHEAVRRLAVRLAGLCGQRLDDASPCVDGILPSGVRLHAVLPPLVDGGPHLSLRLPRRLRPRLPDLVAWGLLSEPDADLLRRVVRSRLAFVVSGGTGSGKTTLLGALLAEVGQHERVLVAEDVRELAVDHPHVVRLQGRARNVEGRGEVTLTDLVRQSLRMRPDRMVVGEVRGAEVRELLTALNTGHEGGCGTLHANGAAEVVSRFEALGALAGMSPAAVHAQLASAVDVVLHLGRSHGRRRLREVALLEPGGSGGQVVTAATDDGQQLRPGPGWQRLLARLGTVP
ncbi:TadA family conjugal transfer-associated ATPase [Ornithinicoccus halotolerans]|uniref:TadA family conjugal transfer-associated ATPase n=1 Tax=Ornithinicoccus halotolerans TaxID=1748220 RepID=UPI001297DB1A|nr:TadA family conjugal transfer-associated ATPase [Ornithinicoccus halotolerans]